MPRVYSHDFNRYFTPKYTIANNVKIGSGLGNEYFRRTNYSTLYDQAHEEEKQFSQIPTTKDGEGIVDTVANIGKTALDFANKNKELLSAVGSIAGAASQISRAADSAKQLEAIKRIQQIRQLNMKDEDRPNDNKEVKKNNDGTPAGTNVSPAGTKVSKIINGFTPGNSTGRGIRKRGGMLKSF